MRGRAWYIYRARHRMPKPSRLTLAKDEILSLFSNASQTVYSEAELAGLLLEKRESWHLPKSNNTSHFISFLESHGNLKGHEFRSEHYERSIIRYSWGKASPLELALSLKPRGYLCHATAVTLHGLVKLSPKMIYLNVEQSHKPSRPSHLNQHGIDLAFSRQQRQSNLIYVNGSTSVAMIAGKNTKQLGVEAITGPASESLQATNLERTLIDIVVRPAYSGGIHEVLKAYRAARDRIVVGRLLYTLSKLGYVYPYHQAIGFLMQKAGYPENSYAKLRSLGLVHKFYLAHGMDQPQYSEDWRLFYPKALGA
jgi:hypothetical protein